MNKTIIVTGIPGTGKTTVCNSVERLARKAGVEVNVINYGTVMLETFKKHEEKMDRDMMRKTSINFQRKLQMEAAKTILEKLNQLKGIKIIDTHMSVNTSQGFLPGLPYYVLQILKPEMFILVEARPREISSRRVKDADRKRDEAVEKAVQEELLFSRILAAACAVLTGAPIKIVINAEGKQEEVAGEILKNIME